MTKKMKPIFISVMLALFSLAPAFSVDLTFRASTTVMIPSQRFYNPGFFGLLQGDVDLFGFLTAGLEGVFVTEKPNAFSNSLTIMGGGVGIGAYYYPLSRLYLGAGGSFGIYSNTTRLGNEEKTFSDLYWRAYGEIGFRINPTISVNGFGGYASFLVNKNSPQLSGPFAGLSARLTLSVGKNGKDGFRINKVQDMPVYPLFMNIYKESPAGTIYIYNQEGADIMDVHVLFRADRYTLETQECAYIPRVQKYKSLEVPLLASFSEDILKFSENGKISGEIIIEYSLLGTKKVSRENVVVDIYNRNTFSWADSSALAAFISPEVQEILEFSKTVAGTIRTKYRTGINRNLETAIAMVETIKDAKIVFSGDTTTPYLSYHKSDNLDFIQYPLQTLENLSGDYDDLGLLLASCLESVQVPTGFLVCDDDFIVLVDMGIKPSAADNHFGDTKKLVVDDSTVYFGLSMKNLSKGFTKSLDAAGKIIKKANNGEIDAEYTNTHEAWTVYPYTTYNIGSSGLFRMPGQTRIENLYEVALNNYVNTEISTVIANARKTGDHNKIGLALIRAGRTAEAKSEFAKSNTVASMNNLGNLYLTEKNFNAAIEQFNKVLAIDPENKTALSGINRANSSKGL